MTKYNEQDNDKYLLTHNKFGIRDYEKLMKAMIQSVTDTSLLEAFFKKQYHGFAN